MTWLYARHTRQSEKNGKIVCRRLLGRWEVFVGDIHMSSRYLRAVWKNVYASLPQEFVPRKILMLGLAAGDNVSLLAARYPNAKVTAVEWDSEMVKLADELGLYKSEQRPEIIIGDARNVIETMAETYDLILVDIFNSKGVAPSAYSDGFFGNIAKLLALNGFVAVNAFRETKLLDAAAITLNEVCRWKKAYNRVGIFQKMRLG